MLGTRHELGHVVDRPDVAAAAPPPSAADDPRLLRLGQRSADPRPHRRGPLRGRFDAHGRSEAGRRPPAPRGLRASSASRRCCGRRRCGGPPTPPATRCSTNAPRCRSTPTGAIRRAGAIACAFGRFVYLGTIAAIRAAALAGDGVAVLPRYLIAADLAAGRLLPILPRVRPLHDFFRLIFRSRRPAPQPLPVDRDDDGVTAVEITLTELASRRATPATRSAPATTGPPARPTTTPLMIDVGDRLRVELLDLHGGGEPAPEPDRHAGPEGEQRRDRARRHRDRRLLQRGRSLRRGCNARRWRARRTD